MKKVANQSQVGVGVGDVGRGVVVVLTGCTSPSSTFERNMQHPQIKLLMGFNNLFNCVVAN